MYETWIVNELGYTVIKCKGKTQKDIDHILNDHPEWQIKCIEVDNEK